MTNRPGLKTLTSRVTLKDASRSPRPQAEDASERSEANRPIWGWYAKHPGIQKYFFDMYLLISGFSIPFFHTSKKKWNTKAGNHCSHWNAFNIQQPKVIYGVPKSSFKTSSWNKSRWPGRSKVSSREDDNYSLTRLWKPLGFTVLVSGVSFTGAAIWQYENVRSQAFSSRRWFSQTPKYGQFRQHMHNWWNKLSVGDKTFAPICAINILVFLAWRVPALHTIMTTYFLSGLTSNARCWPMIFSVFSHTSLFHLGANMFVLHSFADKAVSSLGKEQFVGLYMTAGVFSSLTSYLYKAITRSPVPSLGASGAVMAVLAYVCSRYPNSQLAIILLPQFPFDAGTGLKALVCMDAAGCIFMWTFFDHAAHLGGSLLGIFWHHFGYEYIWKKRQPLISIWHKFRGPV